MDDPEERAVIEKEQEEVRVIEEAKILEEANKPDPKSAEKAPPRPKVNPFKFSRKKTGQESPSPDINKTDLNITSMTSVMKQQQEDEIGKNQSNLILANLFTIADKYDYSKKKQVTSEQDLLEIMAILDKDQPEEPNEVRLEKWKDDKRKGLVSRQKLIYDFVLDYTKNLTNYGIKKYMNKTKDDELARWFYATLNARDEYGDVKSVSALNDDAVSDISSPSPLRKRGNSPMIKAEMNQKTINEIQDTNNQGNLKPGISMSDISAIEKRDMADDNFVTIDPNDKHQKRLDEIRMKRGYTSANKQPEMSPERDRNYRSTITETPKKTDNSNDKSDQIKKRLEERQKKMAEINTEKQDAIKKSMEKRQKEK